MQKTIKKDRPQVKMCGGKRKGSCNVWLGDTKIVTKIKVTA